MSKVKGPAQVATAHLTTQCSEDTFRGVLKKTKVLRKYDKVLLMMELAEDVFTQLTGAVDSEDQSNMIGVTYDLNSALEALLDVTERN